MQKAFRYETGQATHAGKVRQVNEDSFSGRPELGVWLVADGMGGHENGKLASSMLAEAVDTIGQAASAPDLLARFKDRIHRVNAELQRLTSNGRDSTIGSTVAALLVYGIQYAVVWSGDSRVYLVRQRTITQVTRDHSEVQELVDRGVIKPWEAKTWPRRNVVTRAIGVFEDPELETVEGEVRPGDIFVLCSDGLTGHVEDKEILNMVTTRRPQQACDGLVALTLNRGAKDNVTVIVVEFQFSGAVPHPAQMMR